MNPTVFLFMMLELQEKKPELAKQIINDFISWSNEAMQRMQNREQ